MKKRILVLFSLVFSLILVACSHGNKNLSINEVVVRVVKNKKDINSYSMGNILVISDSKGNFAKQQDIKTKEIFNKKNVLEIADSTIQVKTDKENYDFRITMPGGEKKAMYTQRNGGKFTKKFVSKGENYLIRPNYFNLLNTLFNVKDEFSMEETETQYIFTNKDDKFDLFQKFGEEYSLTLTSGKKEDFLSKVKIVVDKSEFRITNFEFELTNITNNFKMTTKTEFTEFNNIKSEDIKVPSDIADELQ